MSTKLKKLIPGSDYQVFFYDKECKEFDDGSGLSLPDSFGIFGKIVNGVDRVLEYNGSTWYRIDHDTELVGILKTKGISSSVVKAILSILGEYIYLKIHKDEVDKSFYNNIEVLSDAIDTRDFITSGHSKRVADYGEVTGRLMKLPEDVMEILRLSSILHDIGKIGLPESILYKPGRLTAEEFRLVQGHSQIGFELVSKINMDKKFSRLPNIILRHHERLDGSGYPDGIFGGDIPLESRIIAVCDVFDALTNNRTYRSKLSFDKAKKILESERTALDSNIIDVFFKIPDSELFEIYSRYEI